MSVHKATPIDDGDIVHISTCAHCGQPIKRVPGGQGPTWVHNDSGAVAATDPVRKVWVVNLPDGVTIPRGGQVMIEQFGDQAPSIAFRNDRWYVWGPPLKSEDESS